MIELLIYFNFIFGFIARNLQIFYQVNMKSVSLVEIEIKTQSHLVESIVNSRHCLCSIQTIEPKVTSTETLWKCMVCWEVFFLKLKISRHIATIVHVIRPVNWRSDFKPMMRVFVAWPRPDWKFCFFHEFMIFGVRINSFSFELLLNQFTFDQSFGLLEVVHWLYDLSIGWNFGSLNISQLRTHIVLNPFSSILAVSSLI